MFTFCSAAKKSYFPIERFSIWPRFDSDYKVRGFEVSEMAYFVIARERIPRNYKIMF